MIKNLALDTNIWLGIIEDVEFDLLEILSESIRADRLTIILPECVEYEFRKRLKKVVSATLKKANASHTDLNSIVETIFYVFSISKKIKTNEIGVNEWVTSGTAPNHNRNNYEDTFVLNTLLTLEKGTNFYFVANDSGFRTDKHTYSLHPDIAKKFEENEIKICFATNLKKTLSKDLGFSIHKSDNQNRYHLYNWKAFKLQIKNKTVLNQLREAVEYYYKELDFIPFSYLSNIFPFKTSLDTQTYFSGTTLKIDNKKLFNFLQHSLIVNKKGNVKVNESFFKSEKDISDFKDILRKFNGNLIFAIEHDRKIISININDENKEGLCNCSECTLVRHAVIDLKLKIEGNELDNSPKNLLKKAYYHYKIKNLSSSLKITQEILDKVDKTEYPIVYSIAQENLSILERMWFEGDDEFEELRRKIAFRDENKILDQGIGSIVGYLKYSKFFDYNFFDLSEDIEKVKNRYNIHNGFGYSSISNIDLKNVIRWSQTVQIISDNGLFFDFYSNIDRFAKITFKQNLYASKDRVVGYYINLYIFKTTFLYLKIEDYIAYFNELGIKELNLHKDNIQDIYDFFDNALNSSPQICKLGDKHPYYHYYIKQIKKIAFLLGYINFSKAKTNRLLIKMYEFYPTEDNDRDKKENLFNSIIKNRTESLNKKNAQIYMKALFREGFSHSFNITNLFTLLENFKSLKLSGKQLTLLLSDNIQKETNYYRSYVLYRLYNLGDEGIKKRVLDKVHEILNDKISFDYKIYSLFSNEKIISVSQNYYDIFLERVIEKFNKDIPQYNSRPIDKEIKNLDILNEFISHIYSCYDDTFNHLKRFMGRSIYYDFLIKPNDIETSDFDIHWFYISYRKSYPAIKKIICSNKRYGRIIPESIFKTKNDRYYRAYVDLMAHINQ